LLWISFIIRGGIVLVLYLRSSSVVLVWY